MDKAAINTIGNDNCTGCFGCYNACQQSAIEMVLDEDGFIMPKILADKCTNCGLCQLNCPVISKDSLGQLASPAVFGAWAKDDDVRCKSSSGGIFSVVANSILNERGVVIGASFNESFNKVEHVKIEKLEDLKKIRGSKYAQSQVNRSYQEAVDFAVEGRKVLFSGTPCQIASLNTFLSRIKDQDILDNVLTCEVVCHGVPSQSVFLGYINFLQKKLNSTIIKFNFRDKKSGWNNYNYSLNVSFVNSKKYLKSNKEDLFMRGYLKNIFLRPACSSCLFAKLPRGADITLGDFWGIGNLRVEEVKPQDLEKGVSLVILNTGKGMNFFKSLAEVEKFEVPLDVVKKNNPDVFLHSDEVDKSKREIFYSLFNSKGFEKAMKKMTKKQFIIKKAWNKFKKYAYKKNK